MTGESQISNGKGRSRINATPVHRVSPNPKPEPKPEPPNGYASVMANRTIGYSLQPGQEGKYRHKQNRGLVTVTRFASGQRWEDVSGESGKAEYVPLAGKNEFPKVWVDTADCTVKPAYGPAFLYPIMALDIAYEPEPEKVEEAA